MTSENSLIDLYSRKLDYLRISITDRCNLRCIYCEPHAPVRRCPHREILKYEEILRIVGVMARMGVRKVRVTGGEPLVRLGAVDFLHSLCRVEGIEEVTLTTNGVLLGENVTAIHEAGVRRINVSLDSLDRETYRGITGADVLDRVLDGIALAEKRGFSPIKINAVALRGVNEGDIISLSQLSVGHPFHIRFIEHMPIGESAASEDHPILVPEIKARISALGRLNPVLRNLGDGPAERFRFKGAAGEVGFIRPLSRHFCADCNRIRLTADGMLRTCLLSDHQVDLKGPVRAGCGDEALSGIIHRAVREKPRAHDIAPGGPSVVRSRMSAIGG